jgi:beta-glucosidase
VAAWGWWNESNHGVNASTINPAGNARALVNTTSYPSDLSLGSTWNPDLVYRETRQIGAEAREVSPGNTENLDFAD